MPKGRRVGSEQIKWMFSKSCKTPLFTTTQNKSLGLSCSQWINYMTNLSIYSINDKGKD
jgi:hypothetical protein